MDKNLNSLLIIDQKIGDFFDENESLSDKELNNKFDQMNYINQALKIINKLSNKNVIELLKRSRYLPSFIDIKKFIKKYPLNKTFLRKNKDLYLDEYKKLRNMCFYLSNISIDYNDFLEYMKILDADNIEKYLLENMPNEQIYELSKDTGLWEEKLFYFSFFKKEKNGH